MTEKKPIVCFDCDSEFFVFPTYEDEYTGEVSFCPYCGSELETLEEDYDEEEDEEE